jgi:hypothetical protein
MKKKTIKNNAALNEVKEFLSKTPAVWVGKARATGDYIMLIAVAKDNKTVIAPYCVRVSSHGVTVNYLEDYKFAKSMVLKLIPELIPDVTNKTKMVDGAVLAYDPAFLEVTSDLNEEFQSKDIKYLRKKYVEEALDAMGVDRTTYVYTKKSFKCELDSSAFAKPLIRGYSNYDPMVLKIMHNSPEYAAMKVDPELESEIIIRLDNGENLIFSGPAGAGKTTAICAVLSKYEIPFMKINGHLNMTSDELVGSQGIDRTGTVRFIEAALALCIKYGMVLVFDEGDSAFATWSTSNGVTDGSRYLQLSNGEIQPIGSNFRMVITMNPGVSQPLPPSTRTRFGIITFDLPTEEQFTTWVQFDVDPTKNILSSRFYKEFYNTYITMAKRCSADRRNVHVAERGYARFLKFIIKYEETIRTNKGKPSLDVWVKNFNSNCYADTLVISQDIDEVQIDEFRTQTVPMIEKLYNIFHEDLLDEEDDEDTIGEFIIDAAFPANFDDIDDEINELFGLSAFVYNTFKPIRKFLRGGRR